jgi:hypothetical protein
MPLKLKNPFRRTKKRRSPPKMKRLLSSDERKRMHYLDSLLKAEQRAADETLGKSLKNSFEKFLTKKSTKKHRHKKSKTHKRKKSSGRGKSRRS